MATAYRPHTPSVPSLAGPTTVATPAPVTSKPAPAGTLPPGTNVTVGKHSVTIERWLSEGSAQKMNSDDRRVCPCLYCAVERQNETCGWERRRHRLFETGCCT